MLQFKGSVRIGCLDGRLGDVLTECCLWSHRSKVDVEVNAIEDGTHMAGSLHGFGLAIDLDTVGDKRADLKLLHEWLRRRLHPQYDVVLEGDHVHVEWDAHRSPAPAG
jgi:hypothetical protein